MTAAEQAQTMSGVPTLGGARSPRVARMISIVPGLGQLYYGAPKRALQFFLGVALPGGALVVLFLYNELLSLLLAQAPIHPLVRLTLLLVSELVELSLLITALSFWIAASWDARQGTLARNAGRDHRPVWWFVKLKRFLFDDPDATEESGDV